MGRINTIYDPINWKIDLEGKSKILEDDIIYKMIIGDGEDYYYYEISELISKYNYDNIINGNYFIKIFPYAELPILLFDENKELIPLIRGTEVLYDKLNQIQREYIENLTGKKILSRTMSRSKI